MSNKAKPGKIGLDTSGDELTDEQLAKASGGMGINAGVAAKTAMTVSTGMTAGSIAEGDTIGGDGMPDPKTG